MAKRIAVPPVEASPLRRKEFLQALVSDLSYLQTTWIGNVDDDTLRRGSVVLRRFVVEDDLMRAWRLVGYKGSPTISATDLEHTFKIIPISKADIAAAGGAEYNGASVAMPIKANFAMDDEQVRAVGSPGENPPKREYTVAQFAKSLSMVVRGRRISRQVLTQYVCNTLGGAHFDMKSIAKNKGTANRLFGLLDSVRDVQILNKPIIYFELLAIGQALSQSPDITELAGQAGIQLEHFYPS